MAAPPTEVAASAWKALWIVWRITSSVRFALIVLIALITSFVSSLDFG